MVGGDGIRLPQDSTPIQFPTHSSNLVPFTVTNKAIDNPVNPTGRKNNVMRWGYNLADGGGRLDNTQHSIGLEMESYYHWDFGGGDIRDWTEAHLEFRTKGGLLYRPWTVQNDVDAGDASVSATHKTRMITGVHELTIGYPAGANAAVNAIATYSNTGSAYASGKYIRSNGNSPDDSSFIQQIRADGTAYLNLIRGNASNEAEVGAVGTPAYMPGGATVGRRGAGSLGTNPAADSSALLRVVNGALDATDEAWGLAFDTVEPDATVTRTAYVAAILRSTSTKETSLVFGTKMTGGTLAQELEISANGNVVIGTGALSTGSANGYLHIRTMPGQPTGGATAYSGRAAIAIDSTNKKIVVNINGAWYTTAALTAV